MGAISKPNSQMLTHSTSFKQIFLNFYQHEDGKHITFICHGCHCHGEASDEVYSRQGQ